ncbi:MAG TPA: SCP2 sterol-binding domain-containing protein [Anaerolineae bacterium]|nr:SCP2 sterol-binding domain-containing protein [Anaerolineae bacterium]HQK15574.1 SCP2 sterol-binding domain-containing protein [Anaerolineae bacterium]
MVTQEMLLEALEKARARMIGADGTPVLPGWDRKIQYHFTDIDEYWAMVVEDGRPQPVTREELDDPDIRLTMSAETFVGLMDKTLSGLVAMTTGKVKVKASMADMRKMQVFM